MKVGDTGEAFFVFETDQDVPADMQTSPITGPVQDEDTGEEASRRVLVRYIYVAADKQSLLSCSRKISSLASL